MFVTPPLIISKCLLSCLIVLKRFLYLDDFAEFFWVSLSLVFLFPISIFRLDHHFLTSRLVILTSFISLISEM